MVVVTHHWDSNGSYVGVVAYLWDSCVRDFCVYYFDVMADLWASCARDLFLCVLLWRREYWPISGIPASGIYVCTTVA